MSVNIKDFGAKGDGIADDTLAIQAALVIGGGIGSVYVPRGFYRVGRLKIPSGVEFFGEGASSVLRLKNAQNNSLLINANWGTGDSGIVIRDLTVDGNKANQTATDPNGGGAHGIGLFNATDCRIENVIAQNCYYDGLYLGRSDSIDSIAIGGPCQRVQISGCTVQGNQRAGISLSRCRDINLHENFFVGNSTMAGTDIGTFGAASIHLEPNQSTDVVERIKVSDNVISGALYAGIIVTTGQNPTYRDISICDNHVNLDDNAITGSWGIQVITSKVSRVRINNNTVDGGCEGGIEFGAGATIGQIIGNVLSTTKGAASTQAILVNESGSNLPTNFIIEGNQATTFTQGINISKGVDFVIGPNIIRTRSGTTNRLVFTTCKNYIIVGAMTSDLADGSTHTLNYDASETILPHTPVVLP